MFPLGTVLLPGVGLPLHVFEPRYRALMDRCQASGERFGITLIERGSEVGGGDTRAAVGCLADIAEARQSPDGRWAFVAVGADRIVVERWLEDDPYPRAITTAWPDAPFAGSEDAVVEVVERFVEIRGLARQLGRDLAVPEPDDDPVATSYRLAAMAPIGAFDRHQLLCDPGPSERLERLTGLLDGVATVLRSRIDGEATDDPPPSGML